MRVIDETKLNRLLDFIKDYQSKYGKSPSYRLIMKNLNFNSLSAVARYVLTLQSRDLIKKDNLGCIALPSKFNSGKTNIAPLVGYVTCGEPIFAYENIEGTYKLPADIFGNEELFLLRAKGDSMIYAGINNGDILTISKMNVVNEGDICVALIGEEATVKRFFKKDTKVVLHPENKNYKDKVLEPNEVKILGKVIGYIHMYK